MKRPLAVLLAVAFCTASVLVEVILAQEETAPVAALPDGPASPAKYADAKDLAQIAQSVALVVATLLGGLWVFYRFWMGREAQTAISIDISTVSYELPPRRLLFVDCVFTNKGKRKVQAKSGRDSEGWAYRDVRERLRHSCSLQVKRASSAVASHDGYLDWYSDDTGGVESVEGIREVNLANEYKHKAHEETDFWMEPGETQHLGATLILSPGDYLLKVTFVGTRQNIDYWSRIVHIRLV